MKKKGIAVLLIVIMVGILFSSCVSQPKYSDYIGYVKEDALHDLGKAKTSNTIRLVLNWVLWGGFALWIPSIVDTVNYIDYLDDFKSIERRIEVIPDGSKVGK